MATIDYRVGGTLGLPTVQAFNKVFAISRKIDCSVQNVPDDDTVQMLNIPADTMVLDVIANKITLEGGTLTFDVGDADDTDGYHDGINGNSGATAVSCNASFALTEGAPNTIAPAYSKGGKYYDAAGVISIIFNDAADAAVIELTAICVNCDPRAGVAV